MPNMSDMPHILHVVPMLGIGGLELAMARVISAMPEGQMRQSVCCLRGEPLIQDRLAADVQVHCMHVERADAVGRRTLPWRLAKLLRGIRPDVIHARNWSAWPDIAIASRLVRTRIPLIWSFHGLCGSEPIPLRRRLAFRLLAAMTSRIFAVSRAAKDILVKDVGLRDVDVILNGVDTVCFKPSGWPAGGGELHIGSVGSLTPWKNHALAIEALALLTRDGMPCRLSIAGEGWERDNLSRLAARLGVQNRVALVGNIADVPAFLNSLDMFVLPSKTEAHPNALLEAMASGLPCVATAVGGCVEVLNRGTCGVLVPDGNAAAMAGALSDLAKSPDRRQGLGRAARDRVIQRYSLDRMIESYRRMYMAAASRRGSNSS